VLKPKKEKLQKLGQEYDKNFDYSDKSTETIIDNFISKFTQSKDKDFLILQNKINDIQTPNNSKSNKQTATGGDSQYKIITEIFKEKPKTMDQFLEYFNKWKEKQSVKTKLDDFKKEWNQIFVAEGIKWDEYEIILNDRNRDAIEKEITEPHKDYMDAKQKVDSIESFNSQTTVPATLTINYLFESKNQEFLKLKIDNFPISASEATGGKQ
jgi:hypothetical protein